MITDIEMNNPEAYAKYEIKRILSLLEDGSINSAADGIKMLASDLNEWKDKDGGIICFGKKYTIRPY